MWWGEMTRNSDDVHRNRKFDSVMYGILGPVRRVVPIGLVVERASPQRHPSPLTRDFGVVGESYFGLTYANLPLNVGVVAVPCGVTTSPARGRRFVGGGRKYFGGLVATES